MITVLPEVMLASVLGGMAVPLALFGFKLVLHRDVDAAQFAPGRYDSRKDPFIAGAAPQENEIVPAKSLLLVLVGGITFGGVVYTVVGIAWLLIQCKPGGKLLVFVGFTDHRAKRQIVAFCVICFNYTRSLQKLRSADGVITEEVKESFKFTEGQWTFLAKQFQNPFFGGGEHSA